MEQQLDLFGWEPPKPKQKEPEVTKADLEGLPPYDPNAFHRIYEMKENGEREWVDSYTSKYSVQYAMKIFYCNLMHWNFFDLNRLEAAHKVLKMSESMRSITIEHEGHLYICTAKPGTTVIEGIGNSRFDYRPFKPK
jgi:hypothetical protein